MDITEVTQDNISIFTISGRVDSIGSGEMEKVLQAASAAGKSRMILDLSKVSYMNSAALRTLAAFLTENQQSGGDLLLVSPPQKIRRVLEIIGFTHFFHIYDSVEAATQAF